jgi:hypothetical protein
MKSATTTADMPPSIRCIARGTIMDLTDPSPYAPGNRVKLTATSPQTSAPPISARDVPCCANQPTMRASAARTSTIVGGDAPYGTAAMSAGITPYPGPRRIATGRVMIRPGQISVRMPSAGMRLIARPAIPAASATPR